MRQARDLQRHAPTGRTLDELLPPLADPGSARARQDLLFRERGFWMYLTSHRLGDLRRLVRQYGRPVAEVFPAGALEAVRPGPYTFADAQQAIAFVTETVEALMYLGCDVLAQ